MRQGVEEWELEKVIRIPTTKGSSPQSRIEDFTFSCTPLHSAFAEEPYDFLVAWALVGEWMQYAYFPEYVVAGIFFQEPQISAFLVVQQLQQRNFSEDIC